MRKLCIQLLLPLLLVLTQQGALLHELSHHAVSGAVGDSGGKAHPGGESCKLCAAFAQVGSAAAPDDAPPLLAATAGFHVAQATPTSVIAADAPPVHSRGPPAAL